MVERYIEKFLSSTSLYIRFISLLIGSLHREIFLHLCEHSRSIELIFCQPIIFIRCLFSTDPNLTCRWMSNFYIHTGGMYVWNEILIVFGKPLYIYSGEDFQWRFWILRLLRCRLQAELRPLILKNGVTLAIKKKKRIIAIFSKTFHQMVIVGFQTKFMICKRFSMYSTNTW